MLDEIFHVLADLIEIFFPQGFAPEKAAGDAYRCNAGGKILGKIGKAYPAYGGKRDLVTVPIPSTPG